MDDLEENDYWPVEGCWSAYDLGVKHGEEDEWYTPHGMSWFDDDEDTDYKDGYNEGRRLRE